MVANSRGEVRRLDVGGSEAASGGESELWVSRYRSRASRNGMGIAPPRWQENNPSASASVTGNEQSEFGHCAGQSTGSYDTYHNQPPLHFVWSAPHVSFVIS